MFPKKIIIWQVDGDLEEIIKLLEEKVSNSRVLSLRCTAMELGPKFYISRKWPSINPFSQSAYTEIVGEYADGSVVFEIRENMVPSAIQVLGVFLVIFLAFVSIETSKWGLAVGLWFVALL